MNEQPFIRSERPSRATANLVRAAGFRGDVSLHTMRGGANNQLFRVDVDGDPRAVLKVYFHHPDDPRDRLDAEYRFSRFAWENGMRALPQPLGWDPQNRLGLYEFVQGRQLAPLEITQDPVQQALDFYKELNRHKTLPSARELPLASEACFALGAHLQSMERRMQSLRGVDGGSAINREGAAFIRKDLSEAWDEVVRSVRNGAIELGLAGDRGILSKDRCISPSDFGFHNALLTPDGLMRFVDFEYAGWDDPAKIVCDFFCQRAVPVPMDYYDMFVEEVVSDLSDPEAHQQRARLLLPLYRLKWCCILLNEFLPVGSSRRRFARTDVEQEERKVKQLQKAQQALLSLTR